MLLPEVCPLELTSLQSISHCANEANNFDYQNIFGKSTSMLWLSIPFAASLSYMISSRNLADVFYDMFKSNLSEIGIYRTGCR